MSGLLDMVRQTVSAVGASGTGPLTMATASVGYRTLANAGAVSGRAYSYTILEGTKWEIGRGHWDSTAGTWNRDTIVQSSAGAGTAETFSAACILIVTCHSWDFEPNVLAKGNSGTGTVTFDVSNSRVQSVTNSGAHTWAFSNWAPNYDEVLIQLTNGGAFSISMPTVNWHKGDGTSSTSFTSMGVTLQAAGVNYVLIWTTDGGATLHGRAL